jgi:ATP-dependent Lhr-like helicase
VTAEGVPGGFAALYRSLRDLETLGVCRRGAFVEGLGGAQFALAGAVERLRELRDADPEARPLVLAATDPANPYGAALPWPDRAAGRASRAAGAYVVLRGGEPLLFVERGGRSLATLAALDDEAAQPAADTLAAAVRRGRPRRLALERVDGEPVLDSPLAPTLVAAGFEERPRRLVLRAER